MDFKKNKSRLFFNLLRGLEQSKRCYFDEKENMKISIAIVHLRLGKKKGSNCFVYRNC